MHRVGACRARVVAQSETELGDREDVGCGIGEWCSGGITHTPGRAGGRRNVKIVAETRRSGRRAGRRVTQKRWLSPVISPAVRRLPLAIVAFAMR